MKESGCFEKIQPNSRCMSPIAQKIKHTHTQNKASPKVINPQKWTSSRMNQMIAQKNSNNDIKYI